MQNHIWKPPPGHNPFEAGTTPADLQVFNWEDIKTEKAAALLPPEAFYYRGHTKEGPYVIVHYRLLDSNTWLWRPISVMDDLTFRGMVESVISWEDGSYQREKEESDAVDMFFLSVMSGRRPKKD